MATEKTKTPKGQIKQEYDPGRYSKTSRRMWLDEKFRELSGPPPSGKALWLYLVTTHHQSTIPGLIPVRESTVAEDLGWSVKDLRRMFAELKKVGLRVETDWSAGLIWLPNSLKHNPPASPNVVTGWRKTLADGIPDCELRRDALRELRSQMAEIMENPEAYLAAFDAAVPEARPGSLTERLSQRLPGSLPKRLAETTTHDARRTTHEMVVAAAPPTATTASPVSVDGSAPAPAPCPPGWEPLVRLVPAEQVDPDPEQCFRGFEIPWTGGMQSYAVAGADKLGTRPPPELAFWAYFAFRAELEMHPQPQPPKGKTLAALRAALEQHGPEAMRKAALCWLVDPWGASRTPPFALNAFLSDEKLPELLARAASVAWQGADAGDWELPETGAESES